MIVGNGDIASVLHEVDCNDILLFASGVSNSSCTDEKEFERERMLLLSQPRNKHLVYFSSLSIYYSTSRYAAHKYEMECLIRQEFRTSSTIVRIGSITWGMNPHLLINVLRNDPNARIDPVYRFVIDKNLFTITMKWIVMARPYEFNMNGMRMRVSDIVEAVRTGKL